MYLRVPVAEPLHGARAEPAGFFRPIMLLLIMASYVSDSTLALLMYLKNH
jgi:hypothetical protein